MHIPDGFLPPSVCIGGYAITGGVTWFCLRQISKQPDVQAQIPKASLLTATFFIASLIHIPVLFASVHFILNGVIGVLLGYYAFPAILIGLFFQAIAFQHGGLSTLGVNACIMGIPALLAYGFYRRCRTINQGKRWQQICAFIAGAGALEISAIIFTVVSIIFLPADIDTDTETKAIYTLLAGHTVLMPLEGVFTVMLLNFLKRVKPELTQSN